MACAFRNGSIHVALSLCVFAAAGGEAPGTKHNRAALTHCEMVSHNTDVRLIIT